MILMSGEMRSVILVRREGPCNIDEAREGHVICVFG